VEIGPRDIAEDCVTVGRRDKAHHEKVSFKKNQFLAEIRDVLDDIQANLFARALAFRNAHMLSIADKKTFYEFFTPLDSDKPEIQGGFALSPWCGADGCESKIKADLGVTVRCIPFDQDISTNACIGCGKPGISKVVFAKAY
jgi:prolyl-tRNA synthetase